MLMLNNNNNTLSFFYMQIFDKNKYLLLGKISNIKDSILYCFSPINDKSFIGELVYILNTSLSNTTKGIVFEINNDIVKILLLTGTQFSLKVGFEVFRSNTTLQLKVDFNILSSIISPFGEIYYGNNSNNTVLLDLFETSYRFLDYTSPSIVDRKKVTKPLLTGINSIDCLFPIGLGQRQLIIGDNNTGKTSLAVSIVLNQKKYNDYSKKRYLEYAKITYFKPCIYVFIGQKRSEALRIRHVLNKYNSLWYTSIIFSSSDDLPIIQYYAPYAGCVIGEWFMEKGYDSILIFDDLSKHSVAYRQITLLLRRPPGREAFPGDVFFLHSRLLERSSQLSSNNGEGSMTCLPIIETLCGDVSSYIPTNVISITDGQIFLNKELLNRGVLPAVDLNLSVSRVGSSSQYNFMVSLSKVIKMQLSFYRQFKDTEFLNSDASDAVKNYINRGKRLTLLFTQPLYHTLPYYKQIVYLFCLSEGLADNININLTNFYLYSIFNYSFQKYLPINISIYYIDFFRNISIGEDNFYVGDFELFKSNLYKFLYTYTIFFDSNIKPILLSIDNLNLIN